MITSWRPVEPDPPGDFRCLWWVVHKTAEETYRDSSGNPIMSKNRAPRMVMGTYGTWSSLEKATHWHPLPDPPTQDSASGSQT